MQMVTSLVRVKRKNLAENAVDISRSAQIRDIEASLDACATNFDLSTLKHPNKPNITPVGSYEIFPNVDIWANTYDLFRFSERPGERASDVRVSNCGLTQPSATLMRLYLLRLRIPDWIVLLCGPWSRMAITSCRIT